MPRYRLTCRQAIGHARPLFTQRYIARRKPDCIRKFFRGRWNRINDDRDRFGFKNLAACDPPVTQDPRFEFGRRNRNLSTFLRKYCIHPFDDVVGLAVQNGFVAPFFSGNLNQDLNTADVGLAQSRLAGGNRAVHFDRIDQLRLHETVAVIDFSCHENISLTRQRIGWRRYVDRHRFAMFRADDDRRNLEVSLPFCHQDIGPGA